MTEATLHTKCKFSGILHINKAPRNITLCKNTSYNEKSINAVVGETVRLYLRRVPDMTLFNLNMSCREFFILQLTAKEVIHTVATFKQKFSIKKKTLVQHSLFDTDRLI
jgi:hypothetical protein